MYRFPMQNHLSLVHVHVLTINNVHYKKYATIKLKQVHCLKILFIEVKALFLKTSKGGGIFFRRMI